MIHEHSSTYILCVCIYTVLIEHMKIQLDNRHFQVMFQRCCYSGERNTAVPSDFCDKVWWTFFHTQAHMWLFYLLLARCLGFPPHMDVSRRRFFSWRCHRVLFLLRLTPQHELSLCVWTEQGALRGFTHDSRDGELKTYSMMRSICVRPLSVCVARSAVLCVWTSELQPLL